MWVLESDGDFLQGKRLWLKPGQRYLFGRVKKDGVRFLIDHKSISRKHFVIEVASVKAGDGAHLHTRSTITITDLKSKGGTQVDGELLKDAALELSNSEHHIKAGSTSTALTIKWVPIVLTFSLTPKEMKAKDPLKAQRERLENLDVKAVADYVLGWTTHVIAGKRNTAKGLQALVYAKSIVDTSFVDALIYAAAPGDLAEEENLSPLEQDFDAALPRAKDYLPAAGKEPTTRPHESYAPDPSRANIFEGYTFVFGDEAQFNLLMPAVTAGHGKALLMKTIAGETNVDECVRYMRNAAGEKGFGDPKGPHDNGGIIMVRWNPKAEWSKWTEDLINGASFAIGQRAIDQREFLDSILSNDPSMLRRSFEIESTSSGASFLPPPPPPPTTASISTANPSGTSARRQYDASNAGATSDVQVPSSPPVATTVPQNSENTVMPAKKKSRLLLQAPSRFKAFDDGFDEDSVPVMAPYDDVFGAAESQSYQDSVVESQSRNTSPEREVRTSALKRSRRALESEEEMVDDLLPAATAMKRRKIEMEKNGAGAVGLPKQSARPLLVLKPKKIKMEIDIREVARQQREAEEQAEKTERKRLDEGLGNIELVKPARLVAVEEMALPVRPARPTRASGESNPRWDEKWNGRKNFKKFRRVGDGTGRRLHRHKVIVPLVEVKKPSYGIGEKYWDRPEKDLPRTRDSGRSGNTQTPKQPRTQTQSDEPTSPQTTRLQQEAAEIVGAIDVESPRRTRLADKTQSQNARPKRGAPDSTLGTAKRQKTISCVHDSESDSDDLKFRFGRRKR